MNDFVIGCNILLGINSLGWSACLLPAQDLLEMENSGAPRDCNPRIPNLGIPAEFSNLVIPGLAAFNPGIMGLKILSIKFL